jgi:hypothetical protein
LRPIAGRAGRGRQDEGRSTFYATAPPTPRQAPPKLELALDAAWLILPNFAPEVSDSKLAEV